MYTKVIGIASFLVGLATGYLVVDKLMKDQYEKDAQEQIDDVKEYYQQKYEPTKETTLDANQPAKISPEESKQYKKLVTNYTKPDLSVLASQNEDEEDEPEEEDSDDDDEDPEEEEEDLEALAAEMDEQEAEERAERMARVDHDAPYLIDFHQYQNENEHYDKIDLYYYKEDDVVCDNDDKKIEDPDEVIGWDIFDQLEMQTNGFVRNEKLHSDFEVHAIYSSYAKDVLGMVETDREKKMRRVARYKKASDEDDSE